MCGHEGRVTGGQGRGRRGGGRGAVAQGQISVVVICCEDPSSKSGLRVRAAGAKRVSHELNTPHSEYLRNYMN